MKKSYLLLNEALLASLGVTVSEQPSLANIHSCLEKAAKDQKHKSAEIFIKSLDIFNVNFLITGFQHRYQMVNQPHRVLQQIAILLVWAMMEISAPILKLTQAMVSADFVFFAAFYNS